ncbi:hypothetical protein FQN54_004353 [Arachnomyces sp. PD_36]|nr:hypothetical protein FQN54_004353 [Arachnomyces sp. PD_36]
MSATTLVNRTTDMLGPLNLLWREEWKSEDPIILRLTGQWKKPPARKDEDKNDNDNPGYTDVDALSDNQVFDIVSGMFVE